MKIKGWNIPTSNEVSKLLFNYCVYELRCIGLADGYSCPSSCPVAKAKSGIRDESKKHSD